MFSNRTAVAAGIIGLLLGLLVGVVTGIVMGNRVAVRMWAGPDYVDRVLDRCWSEEMIAVEAKHLGIARFDSDNVSLHICLQMIDTANEVLPSLSQEQKLRLRQHKERILKNFPELAVLEPGVKLTPEEQSQLRQNKEFIQRNFPKRGAQAADQKPESKP